MAENRFPSSRIERSVVAVGLKQATEDGAGTVRERLRTALPAAMKARDLVAIAALRSALGAIDNAEAVDAERAPQPNTGHARLAGTVSGLRAGEVERRRLSAAEMDDIVRADVADRHAAARDYERAGHRAHAERLRGEAAVLSSCLDGRQAPSS
ncbi:MAG: GatB/YqeY domain-containing protein [Pseudonocardiaceae bacterium]